MKINNLAPNSDFNTQTYPHNPWVLFLPFFVKPRAANSFTIQQPMAENGKQNEGCETVPELQGIKLIEEKVDTPTGPGVYRMLDGEGTVLYVGKAKI